MSLPDDLAKLAELHTNGHLTDEEFATAKKRLLDPPAPAAAPVPDEIPTAEPVTPSTPPPSPTDPWETAVIQSHDGMSDAYWKARNRGKLSPVTIVLMVVALFSCCGSLGMGAEATSGRADHREDWERVAMIVTAMVWFLSVLLLCIWSRTDPVRAGIAAIAVIFLVGALSTLFTSLDLMAEPARLRDPRVQGGFLLLGWIFRLVVIGILAWGVFDARNVRQYGKNKR